MISTTALHEDPQSPRDPQVHELGRLHEVQLQPGDRVEGLNMSRDFNKLELAVSEKLDPFAKNLYAYTFLRQPLVTQLRPKKFRGELRSGFAVVLPTDEETLEVLGHRNGRQYLPSEVTRLLVAADMYSSGRGVIGHVMRQVVYFRKHERSDDGVGRVLGRDDMLRQQNEELVEALNSEASDRARQVASYALRHVLPGGLPGQGK